MRYYFFTQSLDLIVVIILLLSTCSKDVNNSERELIITESNEYFIITDTIITINSPTDGNYIDLNFNNRDDIIIWTPHAVFPQCYDCGCNNIDFKLSQIELINDSIDFSVIEKIDSIYNCLTDQYPLRYTNNIIVDCDSSEYSHILTNYIPRLYNNNEFIDENFLWFRSVDLDPNSPGYGLHRFIDIANSIKQSSYYYSCEPISDIPWESYYITGYANGFEDKYIVFRFIEKENVLKYGWIKLNLSDFSNIVITQIGFEK